MQPLYFYEGPAAIGADKVRTIGLGYLLDEKRGVESVTQTIGPKGGKAGVCFRATRGAGAEPIQASMARKIEWEGYCGADGAIKGLWIGHDPEDPPTRDELARETMLGGHPVKLADGKEWLVPVARYVNGSTSLPRSLKLREGGWEYGDVEKAYRELWEAGCALWDQILAKWAAEADGKPFEVDENSSFTVNDSANLGARALSVNYRISAAEISAFGLFNTSVHYEVVTAVIDFPGVKKFTESAVPN